MFFFFSSRRRHTRFDCDWSSDVCSSDLHAEVGLLRHAGLLEEDLTAPHVAHRKVEDHQEPILLDVERLVEGDALDAVARDLTFEDRVGVRRARDTEPAVGRERLEDRPRDDRLYARLLRAVEEDRHGDRADVGRQRAAERVAARAETQGRDGQHQHAEAGRRHARVTMLTRRLATTTTRSTERSRTHGCTRSSASARRWIRSSGVPTSTWSRLRTLPSTCTTSVTSFFTSATGSASGQGDR